MNHRSTVCTRELLRLKSLPHWTLVVAVLCFGASRNVADDAKPDPTIGVEAAKLQGKRMDVRLPGPIADTVVGGGGRYLIFHLKSLQQLAFFDVSQTKVTRYQPLPSSDITYTAGQTHLFLGLKNKQLIQRWNLRTGKLEVTAPAPAGGIGTLAMGAQSVAPLFLLSARDAKKSWRIDPNTMLPTPIHWQGWRGGAWGPVWINVSFDGSTAAACGGGWAGIDVVSIHENEITTTASGSYTRGETLVAGNGRLMFPDRGPILRRDLVSEIRTIDGHPFPAVDATYSLSFLKTNGSAELTVFANTDPSRLLTIRDLPELANDSQLPHHKRIFLIPAAKVLITVGPSGDHLVLRRFRLTKAMEAEGIDYLFVDSAPVLQAKRGKTYRYRMSVRSRRGGTQHELKSAPVGMQINDRGVITWPVSMRFPSDEEIPVIVEISDDSQQVIFHTFRIRVE